MSNGIGRVWAVNAEGGDEGRPNGVGPVYIENADQLGSKLPEPAAGDAGKVLGVLNSDGDVGWVVDQSGTFTQVQADWNEDDSSQVSYIQNKPTLATVATSGSYADLSNKPTIPTVDQAYDAASANAQSGVAVAGAISGKQDTISDLETIRSGAALGATAVQPSALATVATSGSYNDLSNKPTIPTVSDNVAKLQYGVATYAQVVAAFNAGKSIYLYTGDTDDGAVCSDIAFGDDGGEIIFSRHNVYGSAGSRTEYKVTSSNVWSTTTKNVAIPTVDQTYSASSTNAQSGTAVASAISGKQDTISDLETIRSGAAAGATAVQPSQLATVATSGSYNDLTNKPSIPAAQIQSDWNQTNDQAVDFIKNKPTIPAGVVVDQTYSASSTNAQSGTAVADAISTKQDTISDLETIRSGAALGTTAVQPSALATVATTGAYSDLSGTPSLATVATSGSYADLSNKPTIPAAQVNSDWNAVSGVSQILNKPTIPTVDQSYSASSTNAQSGVAVANAISAVKQVPSSTSTDEGKVLTVNSSGNAVWDAAPETVTIGYKEI